MSATDTAYTIAVIRSREQGLLQEDEYTRIIEAKSDGDALHVLLDTPYGRWFEAGSTFSDACTALEKRLEHTQEWLGKSIDNSNILQFIQTKYDALNISTALIEYGDEKEDIGDMSNLGAVEMSAVQAAIWRNENWDNIPVSWREFIKKIKEQLDSTKAEKDINWKGNILVSSQNESLKILEKLAVTKLMKAVVKTLKDKLYIDGILLNLPAIDVSLTSFDESLNKKSSLSEMLSALKNAGYTKLEEKQLADVREMRSGIAYDLAWNNHLITNLQEYRYQPTGYDPVLAFWYVLEQEVATIRLILSAKLQGVSTDKLQKMRPNLYREL